MLDFKCEVTKADNGFILSWQEETLEPGETKNSYQVFQEEFIFDDDVNADEDLKGINDEEKVAFAKLVHGLANHFGIEYNKYGEENLRVTFDKKGHKID